MLTVTYSSSKGLRRDAHTVTYLDIPYILGILFVFVEWGLVVVAVLTAPYREPVYPLAPVGN